MKTHWGYWERSLAHPWTPLDVCVPVSRSLSGAEPTQCQLSDTWFIGSPG